MPARLPSRPPARKRVPDEDGGAVPRGGRRYGRLVWCDEREASLAAGLLAVLRHEPGVSAVEEDPEAIEWFDGADGSERFHMPLALVRRGAGDLAFVDALPRDSLMRDPELRGARKRIELECGARGASYEIWTEAELLMDRAVVQVLRVASAEEREAYAGAVRSPAARRPTLVDALAGRLLLENPCPFGFGWVARSRLTGIPMAFLCDLAVDPQTRLLVWRPALANAAGTKGAGTGS